MESLISNERECFICKTTLNLHRHHIYFGRANRSKSEEWGCWCYLCARHHNMSDEGVHFNKILDTNLKTLCESLWLEHYNKTIPDFIRIFGRNYIDY